MFLDMVDLVDILDVRHVRKELFRTTFSSSMNCYSFKPNILTISVAAMFYGGLW